MNSNTSFQTTLTFPLFDLPVDIVYEVHSYIVCYKDLARLALVCKFFRNSTERKTFNAMDVSTSKRKALDYLDIFGKLKSLKSIPYGYKVRLLNAESLSTILDIQFDSLIIDEKSKLPSNCNFSKLRSLVTTGLGLDIIDESTKWFSQLNTVIVIHKNMHNTSKKLLSQSSSLVRLQIEDCDLNADFKDFIHLKELKLVDIYNSTPIILPSTLVRFSSITSPKKRGLNMLNIIIHSTLCVSLESVKLLSIDKRVLFKFFHPLKSCLRTLEFDSTTQFLCEVSHVKNWASDIEELSFPFNMWDEFKLWTEPSLRNQFDHYTELDISPFLKLRELRLLNVPNEIWLKVFSEVEKFVRLFLFSNSEPQLQEIKELDFRFKSTHFLNTHFSVETNRIEKSSPKKKKCAIQ